MSENRILSTSGGVAFFALLAIFPGIGAIVSLYGIFADASTISEHIALLGGILPFGVLEVIAQQIRLVAGSKMTRWERPSSSGCSSPSLAPTLAWQPSSTL
jgi:uncharacterized BrkB/YihY/UPF0761 family membrane protein